MMRQLLPQRAGVLALASVLISGCSSTTPQAVAASTSQVIGSAANGCIADAQMLAATGPGYVSIRRPREHYFGHPDTLRFIQRLGSAVAAQTGQVVMVGDLSRAYGGQITKTHRSHQNGLDVDVWLTLAASAERAWQTTPEAHDPPSLVSADHRHVTAQFGPAQLLLLKTAAQDAHVDRIFVNPAIKLAVCQRAGSAAWLHKLRPWRGHDAHFHVRLRCPANSPLCKQQAALPAGTGCGSELAWWFSAAAQRPTRPPAIIKPVLPPPPPAECQALFAKYKQPVSAR